MDIVNTLLTILHLSMSDTTTETKHTMKNILGRDESLYHLLFSPEKENSNKHHKMLSCNKNKRIMYLTEENEKVEISEAIKVTDTNLNPNKLLEEFRSRFPDGEYKGRGVWLSSDPK